jgi:hypothetical protein
MHLLQQSSLANAMRKKFERKKNHNRGAQEMKNCFGQKYENKDCTSVRNCNRCDGRHHTALCDKKETRFANSTGAGTSSSTAFGAGPSSSTATGSAATVTTACASIFGNIILKTATAYVIGPDGREIKTILFADKGSHRSWVLNLIPENLNLKCKQVEKLSVRRFQQEEEYEVDGTKSAEHLGRSPNR